MKTISQLMEQMIVFSNGNLHDITHFITVWTYAKTIGELEGLDPETQFVLEVAAINIRQRKLGYNAAQEFTDQINKHFAELEGKE